MSLRVQFPSDQQAYGSIYIITQWKWFVKLIFRTSLKEILELMAGLWTHTSPSASWSSCPPLPLVATDSKSPRYLATWSGFSHPTICSNRERPPTRGRRSLLELMAGLEPATCWLRISCSTNWATSALQFHNRIIIPQIPSFCNRFSENIFMNFWLYFRRKHDHILIFRVKYDKIDVES